MSATTRSWSIALLAVLGLAGEPSAAQDRSADLILYNGAVWTGDDSKPAAEAVAIKGTKILEVGASREVLRLRDAQSTVIDVRGRSVLPGFIDAHTHFELAADWFFEVRLIDVDDADTMTQRVKDAVLRVPAGLWITGVEWGGLTARKKYSAGDKAHVAFVPRLASVDALTPAHPVLLQRHDGAVFVNTQGLKRLRLSRNTPNPTGGEIQRDPQTGELTGLLLGTAAANAVRSLPPKSKARTLIAAKALIAELNRHGITGIHDIARIEKLSQSSSLPTHIERGHSDAGIFEDLRANGALNVRVFPILPLRSFSGLAAHGITPGGGDELIRYGTLKAFIDGYMMFAPWASNPSYAGDFTMRVVDEQTMQDDVIGADKLGFDIGMHAYGDKAHWLMLNWYEQAIRANGPRERRFRMIHALYPARAEIERAGRIGAVADITPYEIVTGVHATQRILGPQRAETAFPWRTMLKHGVRINIVSDWPGYFDKTEIVPLDPLENIYYAITRRAIGAPQTDAWHPEEALTLDEALRAYTVNPAWSSREEAIKGSISLGKLADVVVLSRDILKAPPEALLSTHVAYTIFSGRIVYQAP